MAIAQDAFFIPDDIATGLATGIYRRSTLYIMEMVRQQIAMDSIHM